MNDKNSKELFQVLRCEMCPRPICHRVTSLCRCCILIWARSEAAPGAERKIEPDEYGNKRKLQPKFQGVVEDAREQLRKKIRRFNALRSKFRESLLLKPVAMDKPFVTEENYAEIDEIKEDLENFKETYHWNLVDNI